MGRCTGTGKVCPSARMKMQWLVPLCRQSTPCCRATLCSCEICQSKGFRRMEVSNFAAVFMIRMILPMRSFENTVRHMLSGISREKMSALCWFAKWVCPFHPRAAAGQCACGFGMKARAGRKNWCDFRRAIFLGRSTIRPTRISPQSPITLPNHRALLCLGRNREHVEKEKDCIR